jgi:hypothetical protein
MNIAQKKQVLVMLADYPKLKARVEELEDASRGIIPQLKKEVTRLKNLLAKKK